MADTDFLLKCMFNLAAICIMGTAVTGAVRAVIITLQGKKPLEVFADEAEERKEKQKARREPGRDKPAVEVVARKAEFPTRREPAFDIPEPLTQSTVEFTTLASEDDSSQYETMDNIAELAAAQQLATPPTRIEDRLADEFDAEPVIACAT